MEKDIQIIQNMIYELFTFYHRVLMIIVGRENIHLGPSFLEHANNGDDQYIKIKGYIHFLNDIIFYIKYQAENTRNQDMGYINSGLLESKYIKETFLPIINDKVSKLRANQITKEKLAEIINSVFFEVHQRIFEYDPLELYELFLENKDLLGEESLSKIVDEHPDKSYYIKKGILEYKTGTYTATSRNASKMKKLILYKTDHIYEKNIRKWIQYIKSKRKQLHEFIAPLPRDLYLTISRMMGVPELSKSPLQSKTKSNKKISNSRLKTQRQYT